jgi:hypothetical protein
VAPIDAWVGDDEAALAIEAFARQTDNVRAAARREVRSTGVTLLISSVPVYRDVSAQGLGEQGERPADAVGDAEIGVPAGKLG